MWTQDGVLQRKDDSDWAEGALYDTVAESPVLAWELIREIARRDQSPELLQALANGPLVSLLCDQHKSVVSQLEADASSDLAAKAVLAHVWEENRLPPEIEAIIKKAGGGRENEHAV